MAALQQTSSPSQSQVTLLISIHMYQELGPLSSLKLHCTLAKMHDIFMSQEAVHKAWFTARRWVFLS
jgi:hypothetical protein